MGRRIPAPALPNRVRALRQAAGLSQQTLAARTGLTRQAISGIEAGQYVPNTLVALRLARALGCAVEDLFPLADPPARVEAEPVGDPFVPDRQPTRVQLARVGGRLVARPLLGPLAPFTPADGYVLPDRPPPAAPVGPRRRAGTLAVDLLIDPALVDRTVVVLGCDPALALLAAHLARRHPTLRVLWSPQSSLAALRALARGEAHAAGVHLRDPEGGEDNLAWVRQALGSRPALVVTLSEWQQGLIVARGNPKGVRSAADLARPDVAIVNRDPGSGSRAQLDAWLVAAGVRPEAVRGYDREAPTHLAVAEAVAAGAADAGPGILAAARALGLDFVPLATERYDLVVLGEYVDLPAVQALLETLQRPPFRLEVEALGGYDVSPMGRVVQAG